MKRLKHIKAIFLVCIASLPLLASACSALPRSQFTKKEAVVNAPFGVVQEAAVQAMAEKNILIKTQETPTSSTISGNLLIDVEQYADCGKYYGKRVTGYADMNFVIIVQRINKGNTGVQITSSVTKTGHYGTLTKERRLTCTSNGRMEEELFEAIMKEMREKSY
jgi:hypothetical protein